MNNVNIDTEENVEKMCLSRISMLPEVLVRMIGDFSPVVQEQKQLVKFEYFDKWIINNTDRVMNLTNKWNKEHVGFVLNGIVQLGLPYFNGYQKGGICYTTYTAKQMREYIVVNISRRNMYRRNDVTEYYKSRKVWIPHNFIPHINKDFDKTSIRVYGAFKAIEEYDTRLTLSALAKGAKKQKSRL